MEIDKDVTIINKLADEKKRYQELEKYLDNITFVMRDKNEVIDLNEMNKWLLEVINFYDRCGIKVDYDTFHNFHKSNISNYEKRNNMLNKYMKVFFRNIHYLDSYDFSKVLLDNQDIVVSNVENPIYEEIVIMINNFNNRNSDIFNKLLSEISKKFQDLGIRDEFFRYENIDKLKKIINDKKDMILNAILGINERKKIKDTNKDSLNKMDEICNIISFDKDKYSDMELVNIVDIIVRIRIFREINGIYDKL